MSTSRHHCRQFSLDEIKEATHNFDDELIIGKGGFGLVYRGSINDRAEVVAIKRLSFESTQGETEFLREIQTLSKLQHDNLVRLQGYCNEAPEKILVYEYMPNGTLADHLYKSKGSTTAFGENQSSHLCWEKRLNICIGAAQGLDFLHRGAVPGVIHRDIKASNILLDIDFKAKIADFGLAKLVKITSDPQITSVSTTIFKGTFGYMDPEYFYTQRLTTKTDVYAFGVVLLVVLSGRPAVDNKAVEDQRSLAEWANKCVVKNRVDLIIDPCLAGKISSRSLKQFLKISQKCLYRQSEQRPTMEEVVGGLQLALKKQQISRQPNESSSLTQLVLAKLQLTMKKKQPGQPQISDVFGIRNGVDGAQIKAGMAARQPQISDVFGIWNGVDGAQIKAGMAAGQPQISDVFGIRNGVDGAQIKAGMAARQPQISDVFGIWNGVDGAQIKAGMAAGQPQISDVFGIRNGVDGAQAMAGWPAWLTTVAGEAIKGWVPRKADSFEKLGMIGQGTYGNVYRARDLETKKIVALKKVRFDNMDPGSVHLIARNIVILRRLDHPNVMKLEAIITSRLSSSLYLVFEHMDHDLGELVASPAVRFSESQIKCYMQQLLRGLEHCHNFGVLHRDITGSNLLLDDNGNLKIGDFGLSTFYRADLKQPLTSRVVTLWYRPPELLLGSTDYGVAVDLWSCGCILAELFAGKPIMPGRTEMEQLHKIFKLCGSPSEEYWKKSKLPYTMFKSQQPYIRCVDKAFKDFPASALALLDSLLSIEPELRGSATSALESVFFKTKPLPCDLSSLPKYPPRKEYDAKRRDAGDSSRGKRVKESRAVATINANADWPVSTPR